ncbi:hypothetical protein Tsubulata_051523 [Turnera subulata]|uniref:DUF4283 domain-containing protein n=1 Tax=Turnera subulata TaxID=218843 RepID=A0A9Q0FR63_9ROSI|nr:hypothetical protein Tsubulata_051523 [Turnera subulata]
MENAQFGMEPQPGDDLPGYKVSILDLASNDEGDGGSHGLVPPGFYLVGKIISQSRRFSAKVVGDVLSKAWNLSNSLETTEVRENIFLFTFVSGAEKQRILNSPWSVAGCHVCLHEWTFDITLNTLDFGSLAFWVQVYGLPPHYMRLSKAQTIVGLFPDLIEAELPEVGSMLLGDFFRMRVTLILPCLLGSLPGIEWKMRISFGGRGTTELKFKVEPRAADTREEVGGPRQSTTRAGPSTTRPRQPKVGKVEKNDIKVVNPRIRQPVLGMSTLTIASLSKPSCGKYGTTRDTSSHVEVLPSGKGVLSDKGQNMFGPRARLTRTDLARAPGRVCSLPLKRKGPSTSSSGKYPKAQKATYCSLPSFVSRPLLDKSFALARATAPINTITHVTAGPGIEPPSQETSRSQCSLFNWFLNDGDLIDLDFHSDPYTWYNMRFGSRCVQERLDRAVVNEIWRMCFDKAQVYHEVLQGSDHRPVVLKLLVWSRILRHNFKFEACWTEEESCGHAWDLPIVGSKLFSVRSKLNRCTKSLSKWKRTVFGNNKITIKETLSTMDEIHKGDMPIAMLWDGQKWVLVCSGRGSTGYACWFVESL